MYETGEHVSRLQMLGKSQHMRLYTRVIVEMVDVLNLEQLRCKQEWRDEVRSGEASDAARKYGPHSHTATQR